MKDFFIVSVDGLSGFPEVIQAVYPQVVGAALPGPSRAGGAAIRLHGRQRRARWSRDLKKIYQADSAVEAEHELESFAAKVGRQVSDNLSAVALEAAHIATMFEMPRPIRKVMYTTNLIESVNSVIRKFTRNRKQYPNRDSALKMIYMAVSEASKRWTKALHNWKEALNHFAIMFEERMPKELA